jgi:hypothetical protein
MLCGLCDSVAKIVNFGPFNSSYGLFPRKNMFPKIRHELPPIKDVIPKKGNDLRPRENIFPQNRDGLCLMANLLP